MSKINSVKSKQTLGEIFESITSGVTGVFVFIILAVFPLYTHDKYFDILGARYVFFKVWVYLLALILITLGILYLIIDYRNQSSSPTAFNRFVSAFKLKNLKKHCLITDVFFIAMLLVCIISTIGSEFKEESFYGNSGRYQGLECWILYFISYFCVTRTFKFKKYYLDWALFAGMFACIWGTLDFFMLDPFGFFRSVSGVQKSMFASSIGNLNTYTNYTIMIFAIASSLFIIEKNLYKSIFYFVATIIGCVGCVFGLADNTVLGFFAFYVFAPFFIFKTRRKFLRYLIVIDILFITMFLFWLGMKAPEWNRGQSSFFRDVVAHKEIVFLFIPITVMIIILYFIFVKMKVNYGNVVATDLKPLDSFISKKFIIAYSIIVIFGFLLVTYILLDMNIFKQHVDLWKQIPSSHQLIFNDNWGTHRGHNWRIAFTNFSQNFNWFKKLFGYGPDTYLVVSERTFYKEMVERYGEVYDSAHNEYINYLICEGVFGLISYLGIFITGIKVACNNLKKNPLLLACIMAVICYMVQAMVNIAIPITTPIYFNLMYIGVASYFEYFNDKQKVEI